MNNTHLKLTTESSSIATRHPAAPLHSSIFAGVNIRVFGTPDAPLFVAADVARILELGNPREILRNFPDDEKGVIKADTLGGAQGLTALTEPGLYRLIFRSNKPQAEDFRRWVFHDVLPAIRKAGSYHHAPQTLSEALLLALKLEAKREQLVIENATLSSDIERMEPKEQFFDAAMSAKNGLLVRDAAKILGNHIPGGMGEKRLFKWLRGNGWLMPGNRPYQDRIDSGHMTMTERPVLTNSHGTIINITPRITQKGLVLLHRRLAGMDKAEANKAVYGEEAA